MMQQKNHLPEKDVAERQILPEEPGNTRAERVTGASRDKMDGLFNYQATAEDLSSLRTSVDELYDSDLIDPDALTGLRVITFDSTYLYVLTQGNHVSTDQYVVEEMTLEGKNPHEFKLFKIGHHGRDGQTEKSYGAAKALAWDGPLVSTVTDTEHLMTNPYDEDAKSLAFKAIHAAPQSQFDRIHKQRFDYQTDVMFHEAGHIEEYSLKNWKGDHSPSFPTQAGIDAFCSTLRTMSRIPLPVINLILSNLDRETISELYAMTMDREARRKLRPNSYSASSSEDRIRTNIEGFSKLAITPPSGVEETILDWSHSKAEVLAYALEEVKPDYAERKRWLQGLLSAA